MNRPTKSQDERVSAQRRKISNEAFGILMLALIVSILIQQFLCSAPFKQYAGEFICFFGISLYVIVRYLMLGLNLYGEETHARSIILLSSFAVGITVTAVNGISNYSKYGEHYSRNGIGLFYAVLAVTFLSAFAITFIGMSLLHYLNQLKQAKLKKHLDEMEQND